MFRGNVESYLYFRYNFIIKKKKTNEIDIFIVYLDFWII